MNLIKKKTTFSNWTTNNIAQKPCKVDLMAAPPNDNPLKDCHMRKITYDAINEDRELNIKADDYVFWYKLDDDNACVYCTRPFDTMNETVVEVS